MAALLAGGALLVNAAAVAEPLNTLAEVGRALNACWVGPPPEQAFDGMEITVRFSFTRDGTILGEPRFTFITPSVPQPVRTAYQRAVAEALMRCAPLSFTPGLAGAIAGRPFAWRIVDHRKHGKA